MEPPKVNKVPYHIQILWDSTSGWVSLKNELVDDDQMKIKMLIPKLNLTHLTNLFLIASFLSGYLLTQQKEERNSKPCSPVPQADVV